MSESDLDRSGEELVDESGRNPTQRELDDRSDEGEGSVPVDTDWEPSSEDA